MDELKGNKYPKTTQDEEMWKLMLQKEQSRYVKRNRNSICNMEKIVMDKSLKVLNQEMARSEIFINGKEDEATTSSHRHSTKEASSSSGGTSLPPANGKLSAKARSYSVPRRLDKNSSSLQVLNTASSSTEINLDVSLLPIFHKILSDQQRTQRLSYNKSKAMNKNKKFMLSCPNIMIKCDIVEYL